DDKAKTYGEAEPALTYTPSGTLYYGDTYTVISGVVLTTATGGAATFGTHPIVVTLGAAANYDLVRVNGTLTVAKAVLTVTADDKAKTYGEADPALTYTPSGTLYYGDTYTVISGVVLTTATGGAATFGTPLSLLDALPISNYDLVRVNGTLTVAKAVLTVTADDKA